MRNIKITIAYDGTRYNGWQRQDNTDNTIQGKLEALLSKMTGEEVEIHGSGRTDAGVHAMGNVAVFDTETTIPAEKATLVDIRTDNKRFPRLYTYKREDAIAQMNMVIIK